MFSLSFSLASLYVVVVVVVVPQYVDDGKRVGGTNGQKMIAWRPSQWAKVGAPPFSRSSTGKFRERAVTGR